MLIGFLIILFILVSLALFNWSCWNGRKSYKEICSAHVDKKDENIILFYFFTKHSCSDCYRSMFTILKNLPSYFYFYGVMPDGYGVFSPEYFKKIGLKIEIIDQSKLNDDSPRIYPSLAGYKKNGDLIFLLPLVNMNPQILEEYLFSLYYNNVGLERKSN